MHSFYILEFIIFQIIIVIYFKNLVKNEITSGSIGAFGGLFFFECLIIYNLITKNSMLLDMLEFINKS